MKKKLYSLLLSAFALFAFSVSAQAQTYSGQITLGAHYETAPGTSVVVPMLTSIILEDVGGVQLASGIAMNGNATVSFSNIAAGTELYLALNSGIYPDHARIPVTINSNSIALGQVTFMLKAATYNFTWLNSQLTNNAVIDLQGATVMWDDGALYTTGLSIDNKNVTIKNGVIDGASSVRIFNITATGTLTLENITLQNGYFSATAAGDNNDAGAILNKGTLNISESIVQDNLFENTAPVNQALHGGAISNLGTLSIDNCSFLNNRIYVTESTSSARAGAIYNKKGTMTIKNSTFRNNTVGSYTTTGGQHSGGALYIYGGNVDIENSVFDSNGGGDYQTRGGAMYINSGTGYVPVVNITGSVFKNNYADGVSNAQGGVMYMNANHADAVLDISYSVFSGNRSGVSSSKSILIYTYDNPGTVTLSSNFWGTNNSSEFGINGTKTMDNYFTVKLGIDSPEGTLSLNDPLLYHVDIALNEDSDFDLEKLPSLSVEIKNNDTDALITSITAQDYLTAGSLSTELASNDFTLALYYNENLINTAEYIIENVSIPDVDLVSLKLYPNPVTDILYVNSPAVVEKVSISTITGATVLEQNNVNNSVDVSALPNGVYFVKVNTANGEVVRKIVK